MTNLRSGFSMLVAIFTIVLLSLVASYIFYASSSITKEGNLQYQKEQAILLARSYTEYAVMAVSANDRTNKCIDTINTDIGTPDSGNGYKVYVKITYIGNNKYINKCKSIAANLNDTDIDTLSIIVDVYIKYKDILNPTYGTSKQKYIPWQTYHKRSLQKI